MQQLKKCFCLQVIWIAIKVFGSKVFDVELLRCTVGKVCTKPPPTIATLTQKIILSQDLSIAFVAPQRMHCFVAACCAA